jgi:hypothetical protein
MKSLYLKSDAIEVVVTGSEEKSPFELITSGIQLLIEQFDPRDYEETRGKYTLFHETILNTIGQHILDYTDMSLNEKERYSIKEVLLGEIDYMNFDNNQDTAI